MNNRVHARSGLRTCGRALLAAALSLVAAVASAQVQSVRLADVIRASGSGSINLMMSQGGVPITAAQLEALRLDHVDSSTGSDRNFLSFGVDVNENSKGLESSSAQGISIAEVTLTVTRAGGSTVYSNYRTQTQALLASTGSRTRAHRYTVLGEGGSSRITASNAVQSTMDSTLDVFVPDSLADATAAVLSVRLLDTNKTLGDPESFYDYSGGFEDLAILNRADSYYINVTVATTSTFRSAAPAVEPVTGIVSNDGGSAIASNGGSGATTVPTVPSSWSYWPSAASWYVIAYEDSYPSPGDYDFNDAVVAYRYRLGLNSAGEVMRIEAETYLLTDGAARTLDWRFRLPVAGSGTATCSRRHPTGTANDSCTAALSNGVLDALVYPNIDDAVRYFSGASSWSANTETGSVQRRGAYGAITLVLDTPQPLTAVGAADPWLQVRETNQTITLALRDSRGWPYALLLPSGWKPPRERVDMGVAYARFLNFMRSGGAQDSTWYQAPDAAKVFDIGTWQWGP